MICSTCGRGDPLCPACGVNPPHPVGGPCPACVAADVLRVHALATALECAPKDVTSAKLEPIGRVVGKLWHEVTPADVAGAVAAMVALAKAAAAEPKP